MSERKYRDKEVLERLYVDEGLSSREVADKLNCAKNTVLEWLHKHGIDVKTPKKDRVPNFQTGDDGYERIKCQIDGTQYSFLIHRLVAVAEYGFDKASDSMIHHKSGVPWDNRPSNLEPLDGQKQHVKRHRDSHARKLTPEEVREIRKRRSKGESGYKLADEFGVSDKTIYDIANGETWWWLD